MAETFPGAAAGRDNHRDDPPGPAAAAEGVPEALRKAERLFTFGLAATALALSAAAAAVRVYAFRRA